MRPIWSGALSFGLVNIFVELYSGTKERNVPFALLHKKDLSPIRYARFCKKEDKEIPYEEIVKGFAYQKGKYVVIEEKDFEKAVLSNTKLIEIQYFTDESEIDSIYWDKVYFLAPEKKSEKSFSLLVEILKKSKKVGVGIFGIHSLQHIGIIKPYQNGLMLQQLRYKTDIKKVSQIFEKISKKPTFSKKELESGLQLIDQMRGHFLIEKFKDIHAEILHKIIQQKLRGRKLPAKRYKLPYTSHDRLLKNLLESLKKYPAAHHKKSQVIRKHA